MLLVVIGYVQAQADVLLSWLNPLAAGRVLSLIGIAAAGDSAHSGAASAAEGVDDNSQNSGV